MLSPDLYPQTPLPGLSMSADQLALDRNTLPPKVVFCIADGDSAKRLLADVRTILSEPPSQTQPDALDLLRHERLAALRRVASDHSEILVLNNGVAPGGFGIQKTPHKTLVYCAALLNGLSREEKMLAAGQLRGDNSPEAVQALAQGILCDYPEVASRCEDILGTAVSRGEVRPERVFVPVKGRSPEGKETVEMLPLVPWILNHLERNTKDPLLYMHETRRGLLSLLARCYDVGPGVETVSHLYHAIVGRTAVDFIHLGWTREIAGLMRRVVQEDLKRGVPRAPVLEAILNIARHGEIPELRNTARALQSSIASLLRNRADPVLAMR